ncbi:inositol monophosphatase family protein, partial [Acinetobacter baumannii]
HAEVQDKGGRRFDPVTAADQAAETAMRELIAAPYPDHGIHGEAHERIEGTSPLTWVLDPIDGTRAFITGLPLWGTLIALNDGDRPVLGV